MTYTPVQNVVDVRSLKDNMIAYFEATQVAALRWANGDVAGLPSIAKFHKSIRLTTVFPALTILQLSHRTDYEDILNIDLNALFQFAAIHGNQDTLADRSTKYSMALESMLANMPKTTFNTGSILTFNANALEMETVFDLQAKYKTQFIQVFETQVRWSLTAQARV